MNWKLNPPFRVFLLLIFFSACKQNSNIDYTNLPAFTEKGVNAVIEIPAGTNHKIEFDGIEFKNDQKAGKDRVVDFLPYPGNYGFIPGTKMAKNKGGDGDALNILVLGESVSTGTLIEVLPIAALILKDGGALDTKIIAIPRDSSLQVMAIDGFTSLMTQYNVAQTILKDWFLNYKGLGEIEFVSWQNERFAEEEIRKWTE